MEFANQIVGVGANGEVLGQYTIPFANAGPNGLGIGSDGPVWWSGKRVM